jgi:replicative DNA helicase
MTTETLPSAPEAELALLGACVIDQTVLVTATEICSGADFHDPELGQLFDAFWCLNEAGIPLHDAAVLVSELRRLRIPEAVRSPVFLAKLFVDGEVHAHHAVFYARQVKRAATLRRLQSLGLQLATRIADPAADPGDIAAWIDAQLSGLGHHVEDPPRRVDELATDLLAELRQPSHEGAIFTGLRSHDIVAGGWMPGELIILAARPGVGKTSLAMQIAQHNAVKGRPVLFVSLEMTGRELAARLLCGLSGVDSRRLRAGRLDAANLSAIERASVEIGGVPLRVWAPPMATLARIRAMAKRDAAASGLALLVVDYLGLVRPADPKRPRHEQIGEVSAGLKALAKELSVPVLSLSQLNREADGNEPRLSHLRDSGSIEQDADVVLFIHREDEDKTAAKLIVAKHRHGDTGVVHLAWDAARTRYEDPAGEIVARGSTGKGTQQ